MKGQLNWIKGGLLLGVSFLIAVALVKPIGVSTQFVIANGIVWNLFSETVVQEDVARPRKLVVERRPMLRSHSPRDTDEMNVSQSSFARASSAWGVKQTLSTPSISKTTRMALNL